MKNITIVGGYGKMGAWFARLLKNQGHRVSIIGRDKDKLAAAAVEIGVAATDRLDSAAMADIIIISVPVDSFETVCGELAPHVHAGQMVFDLTSVKVMPVAAMQRSLGQTQTLGVHPVFGPGAESLNGQNIILTPTNDKEQLLAVKVDEWLTTRGARVRITSPEEHDRLMSISLGLAHFIAIVTADALVSLDKLTEMSDAGGITYKALLTLVESVLSEDPALYASLQLNLPALPEMEILFGEKAVEWAGLVRDGRREDFINRMSNLKNTLEAANPDFGASYQKLYHLANRRRE
ncbi:MAG: prephenate dehydrogenase [Dehalogenimonas sp.]|uniref:Prephenate dehydrogenase n=1 Tax=Candidatus Dehalogenimonas loeffleri TaxID=3127115 RepID=A0ABZ2J7L4_9CHLR|nr:prephenate dehydrogenase [Dehalogenimonas sp.]